jgi:transcriptional regulator with XRE-family HTH domain
MPRTAAKNPLETVRLDIASKVRDLRKARRWTQAELSGRLHLSQNRLSEIERGAGSFTAEQLLAILKLFNVPLAHFASDAERDEAAELQNALVRLGALHLQESDRVLPSERLDEVSAVVREAIITGTPRIVTAVAPVLVRNADRLNLGKIVVRLAEAGLETRLAWLIDNTLDALKTELDGPLPRPWAQLYRRAAVVLDSFQESAAWRSTNARAPDVLDAQIRTKKTLEEVRASSSPISHKWGIVTGLQPADFAAALKAARVDH